MPARTYSKKVVEDNQTFFFGLRLCNKTILVKKISKTNYPSLADISIFIDSIICDDIHSIMVSKNSAFLPPMQPVIWNTGKKNSTLIIITTFNPQHIKHWVYIIENSLANNNFVYRIVSNKHSPSNKRPPNLFSNKTR